MLRRTTGYGLLLFGALVASNAYAQVPHTIGYQGYLSNTVGGTAVEGGHSLVVSLYTQPSGGSPIFSETHNVTVVKGVFNVIIGSATTGGIPATVPFNQKYWIGINVDGTGELSPRTEFTSSPYSFNAMWADSARSVRLGSLGNEHLADGSINLSKLSAANSAPGSILTSSGTSLQWNPLSNLAVTSLNGQTGDMVVQGGTNIQVNRSGNTLTINSLNVGTINTINTVDDAIVVTNPNGPTVTLGLGAQGVTESYLRDSSVTTPKLRNGAVTNAKLATNAVTSDKILDGTIATTDLGDAAVTTAKLADGSVSTPKLADNAVTSAKILDGAIVNADVSATAAIAYGKLNLANSIVTGDLTDGSVTTPKLADGAVITAKLADGSVITAKLADVSVTSPKIADGAVITAKLADGSVITAKLADVAVTTPKIADEAVTSAKIADGSIVNADVNAAAAIAYSKLNLSNSIVTGDLTDGSVNSAKIADGSIVNADVSPTAAIAYSKLALTNSIVTADLTDGSVTTPKLADGSVTTAKIADAAVTDAKVANGISYSKLSGAPTSLPPNGPAGGDLTGTYPNPTVAAGAITSAKIADGAIVNADVNAAAAIAYSKLALTNSIVTGDLTDGSVNSAKIADGSIVNADVSPTAAIAYSKLALTNSIVTADLTDGSVTTAKIADAAVTDAKVANGISYSKLSGAPTSLPPSGAAGGDLSGTYPNPQIAAGSIVNADVSPTAAIAYSKLALTNSIVTSDLTNGSVTSSKLADSAVSGLKLGTAAVNTAHIADGAVTDAKVANGISYSKLSGAPTSLPPSGAAGGDLTGTYPNPTVAAGAITSAKIADGTITNADISATASIAYSKLALTNSIVSSDLTNGSVTNAKLADSAVSGLKLGTAAVNTAHIADGAVTDAKVANGISYSKLSGAPTSLPPSGAAGGDLTGTYPNPTVAANAITSVKIADGTITNADISAAASIAYAKLNLTGSLQGSDIAAGNFTSTNSHRSLANNDNVARELRFLEPSGSGVNFTAFKAQAQAGDITYTLPNTAPSAANQVLQVQAVAGNNATLSWGTIGGNAIVFTRTGVIANAGNTSYTVQANDDIVGVDMSAGTNFTVNLPPATTAGEFLIIKMEKSNQALLPVLTIQPNGTDKIDGANNVSFSNPGGNRRLYSDGAGNWYGW